MRSPTPRGAVVVIGGANVDVKCRARAAVVAGTSNPGEVRTSAGGVARNVAENLARLGVDTHLVAAVGRDVEGDRLLAETAAAGVRVDAVHRTDAPTGVYVAVLEPAGELVVAVSSTAAAESITAALIDARRDLVARSALLVVDCNLPEAALARALGIAANADVPVMADPVSVAKASRLRGALGAGPLHTVTPNVAELAALVRCDAIDADDERAIVAAASELHAAGVAHVWVRRGALGSVLVSAAPGGARAVALAARPASPVDVTGAGDAMLAAYAWATLLGHAPRDAARRGHAAAALTVASDRAVSPDLSAAALDAALDETLDAALA